MKVLFNAKTFDSKHEIKELVKERYRQVILHVCDALKDSLDLSLLNSIIIPDDYKTELFEFQRNNGHKESLTENEYARGFAQVVSSQSHNNDVVYNVIIDKAIIQALLCDDALSNIKNSIDEAKYKELIHERTFAINTLCHELAHVYAYNLKKNITWLEQDYEDSDLKSLYSSLALSCWDEYFASRIVSATYAWASESIYELKRTCNSAEEMLNEKRREYNHRNISLTDFAIEFHKYTDVLLKNISYLHGNLFCLTESREHMVCCIDENLDGTYIKSIWIDFGQVMDTLFKDYPNWKNESVLHDLTLLIEKYYNQFDIYLSQKYEGIYYDIPVKL